MSTAVSSWGWNTDTVSAWGTAGGFLLAGAAFLGSLYDRRRTQARQVAAWFERDSDGSGVLLHAQNSSDEPVYRVRVEHARKLVDDLGWSVLPPGKVEKVPGARELVDQYDGSFSAPIQLTFTDAAGRRWRRTYRGRLERVHLDRKLPIRGRMYLDST